MILFSEGSTVSGEPGASTRATSLRATLLYCQLGLSSSLEVSDGHRDRDRDDRGQERTGK